jgi:hypothetical protein
MSEKEIFDAISSNNFDELKIKLASYNGNVDFIDENGEKFNFHKKKYLKKK